MLRRMLRAKIHRATVTGCDPDYVGSLTVDADLLAAVDIRPNEAIWVYDIDNGVRFETYIIRGEAGSGVMMLNGAAAKLVEVGHKIIVACYAYVDHADVDQHVAHVVVVDEHNRPAQHFRYDSVIEAAENATLI